MVHRGRRWAIAAVVVGAASALGLLTRLGGGEPGPIRVGVLHSLTGTMAISARAVMEATLMAIDELNAAGGVLGRSIEPVVRDGASDPATFAREAERLITVDQVAATFGCWTSSGRKQVKPVIERHRPSALLSGAVRGFGGVALHRLHGRGAEPADHPCRDLGTRSPRAALLPGRVRLCVSAHRQRHHSPRRERDWRPGRGRGVCAARLPRHDRHRQRDRARTARCHSQYDRRRQQCPLLPARCVRLAFPRPRFRPCRSASARPSLRRWA